MYIPKNKNKILNQSDCIVALAPLSTTKIRPLRKVQDAIFFTPKVYIGYFERVKKGQNNAKDVRIRCPDIFVYNQKIKIKF